MSAPTPSNTGFISVISGKTPFGEIILGLVINVIVLTLFFTAEGVYSGFKSMSNRFQTLMDYTANSVDKALVIHQDPAKYANAKQILFSENEPTGVEFAYSFYLFVNPNTFDGAKVLHHVWHKGYGCVWPLMGPGVFIRGDTNAMRIVMNTYENPYTYVDVTNIPVRKWFHVVLNCRKGGLEVHVNGNLVNKIRFDKTVAYMNFQDIVLFSNANYTLRASTTPALAGQDDLQVLGAFNGYMSEFIYTRYALSFTEIQSLMNKGPSKQTKTATMELPPYMADNWWTTNYNA